MPVFNAGDYLRTAIESILGQTLTEFEFLIVDDGSTDGSRELLAALRDPRVRNFFNERNLGNSAARNLGLAKARGDFIAFLNHDDLAHPQRLARQVAFLRDNPAVCSLGTGIETTDAAGARLSATVLPTNDLGIRWFALVETPLRQSSLMVRRVFLEKYDLRYDPEFRAHSDYDFVVRALRHGPAANLPEVLTHYRRHPGCNSTRARTRMIEEGNRISLGAINRELPAFGITLEQVAQMRAIVTGDLLEGLGRTLVQTKRAWQLYLDLCDAFREKHRDHPDLSGLQPRSVP